MPTTPDKHRQRLTTDQLESILEIARTGRWVTVVLETFKILGVDLSDPDCGQVNPMHYAIPVEQWEAICAALNRSGTSIGSVGRGLDWMNYGPSSYEDES